MLQPGVRTYGYDDQTATLKDMMSHGDVSPDVYDDAIETKVCAPRTKTAHK